jgi:diguanylate cyclase (GGDEF)-like protein/PAS domain S-box-containing protein
MFRVFNCIGTEHDWRLVVLASIVCFLASGAAIDLFHRARTLRGRARAVWLLTASVATGSGVWATHFIAMLAFDPGIPISFSVALTVISLLVAIAVTATGLALAIYGNARWSAAAGGAIVGLGISCMHYTGIAAVQFSGVIIWDSDLVAASIVLGAVFGALAFEMAVRGEGLRFSIAAVGLFTIAVLSDHFTAMGAAGFLPGYAHDIVPKALASTSLSVAIAVVAAVVLGMCLIGAWSDRRNRRIIGDKNTLFDVAINNMVQGLCMFDGQNRLLVWNQRYQSMYKIDPKKIRAGCGIRDLLEARRAAGTFPYDPAKYEAELRAALNKGEAFTLDIELQDGRIIAVANTPMNSGGWVATHEDITERKRAERGLEDTRSFLDTVIENVPSPIVVKEAATLRYLLINGAAERLLGIDRHNLLHKTAAEVMPPVSAKKIDAEDRDLIDTGKPLFLDEHAVVTPGNGTRIVTTTRLAVRDVDGKPRYLISMFSDLTERKRSEQRIAHMANHDALTDLPNRPAFNACISATVDLAALSGESFAVLSIDIDRFKAVNDVFGHSAGDALLREAARRMETACQGAFLARVGGDEFIVITPTAPQPTTAEALATRLTAAFASDIEIDGHAIRVGLTVGIGIYPQDGADAATLVANADAALFRAKSEARGSIRFFEISMDKQLREKRALQEDLRTAVLRDQLMLHYQPQARIDGEITGFEALARWNHPRHGLVPPNTFIPLAEENGLIDALGEWVLRAACREAASWPRPLTIAINLSPAQFQHGDLPNLVHQVLLETGLSPKRLELEITEGVLIGDFTRAVATLRRLKNLGVRIAMDDFGTGYSSLSYLQSFPFDKIKIDQSFIANLGHSQQAATIVRAVIALSRGLDVPVAAEGVETEEQLKFLAGEHCNEIQGYLIGRPKAIADYAQLVGRQPSPGKPNLKMVAKMG